MHIPKWDSGPYLKTPVLSLLHFLFTPQVSHVSLKLPERLFSAPPSGCFCLTLFLLSAPGYKTQRASWAEAKHTHGVPGLSSVEMGQA